MLGVYAIQKEGAEPGDDPEDIGVLIKGVDFLINLKSTGITCALLFGLIYCLNLSYPPELKCTFEVIQKHFLNLDGQRFSSKAKFLKKLTSRVNNAYFFPFCWFCFEGSSFKVKCSKGLFGLQRDI